MNTTLRCLAVALLLAVSAPGQRREPLCIGTWNLEMLGCRTDPPRTDADVQAIADCIRGLHIAVLAVQEVGSEAALADLARRVGPDFDFVLGTTGDWNDGKTRQSVGFLYDKAQVQLLQAEELLTLPRQRDGLPIFHRVPVSACFRGNDGGVDFRAITVHFKAGQKPQDEQKRSAEAGLLRDYVQHLLDDPREDHDIVVLGDFNHGYDTGPWRQFTAEDVVHYLRPDHLSPTIVHFDTPIDMVATTRAFAEALEPSLAVHNEQGLADKDAWAKVYSDHFPVTLGIDAARDRDPDATFTFPNPAFVLPKELRQRAAAPAAPAATGEPSPLPVGTTVRVRSRDGDNWTGVLLQPLGGAWIYLRSGGKVVALPADWVAAIVQQ